MRWRRLLMVFPVLVLSACLETDLTLKPNGSVAGKISWTSVTKLPDAGARALLKADDVTVKQLELKDVDIPAATPDGTPTKAQRVTAQIEAKSVEALTRIALLQSLGVSVTTATPEPSKHSLTVKAAKSDRTGGKLLDTESTIRLHLPGPVEQTSATAKGDEVTWKVPAADYKSKPNVELTVTYGEAPATGAGKDKKKP